MPQAKPQSGGVVAVRSKQAFVTPPGLLGFSNLIEPDDAFDSLKFKANAHFTPEAEAALAKRIEEELSGLWPDFLKECAKPNQAGQPTKPEPKGGWQRPDPAAWIEEHLKEPKEASRIQQPYIIFANDAEYRDKKTGQMTRKTMRAYDAHGAMVDLAKMKVGMGSTVQCILTAGLFVSPLVKQPTFSFKLQGIRVIKLVQFGAGGGGLGQLDEEDMALLGDDSMEMDDLSAYAPTETRNEPKVKQGRTPLADDDFDADEIPF